MSGKQPVVGTYRLLRQDVAENHGGFLYRGRVRYREPDRSSRGFTFSSELDDPACCLPYRTNAPSIAVARHLGYVRQHRLDVMIGCASFEGTDPERLALAAVVSASIRASPGSLARDGHSSRRVEMNRMAKEANQPEGALHELTALIKGYLRLGAYIGDGAVIDHQFGTTDVLIVMPVFSDQRPLHRAFRRRCSRHAA